jgi:hypothetical protein
MGRYNKQIENDIKSFLDEEKDKEETRRNGLWANVDLCVYDVVRMTEDEFTRLSAIPNFGNIIVQGKMNSMNFATAIKYYNLDLYAKYKLLLDDYVEAIDDNEDEEDEEEYIDDGNIGYGAYLNNKHHIRHAVNPFAKHRVSLINQVS